MGAVRIVGVIDVNVDLVREQGLAAMIPDVHGGFVLFGHGCRCDRHHGQQYYQKTHLEHLFASSGSLTDFGGLLVLY